MHAMIIIILIFLGILTLLVGAVVAVIFMVGKNQRQFQKKSVEAEKIDNMLKDGKITQLESVELKKAVGFREFVPGLPIDDRHMRILSILEIINATLGLLISPFLIFFICCFFFIGRISNMNNASSGFSTWASLSGLLIGVLGLCLLAVIVLRFWAALRLKSGSQSARMLILIFSVFDLTSFPIGTALGLYAFWVLLFREGAEEYYKVLSVESTGDASNSMSGTP